MQTSDSESFDSERRRRYQDLRHKVLGRMVDASEAAEFEAIVLSAPELKADFAEFLHQESSLLIRGNVRDQVIPVTASSNDKAERFEVRRSYRKIGFSAAVAAMLLVATTLGITNFFAGQPSRFLVIASTKNCQWGLTTSATAPGKPLPAGRFMLNSGIAVLKLPLVDLSIEGPTDIEVISSKRCMVRSGRVFANVYPGGEGFVVETPTCVLTDRGTIFAVNVSAMGDSDLTVIKGIVDAEHRATGESFSVGIEAGLSLTSKGSEPIKDNSESGSIEQSEASYSTKKSAHRQMQITTAVGKGRDAYVIAGKERSQIPREGMLLAKITPDADWLREWRRRAYLHFDLSLISGFAIQEASLQLRGLSTNIGYLSQTPDSTFAIYGLTEEAEEEWREESINWENSPGVLPDHWTISPAKTKLLGRFVVMSSDVTGLFKIDGEALVDFLSSDTNGGATLILVAETMGQNECWAHGFASGRHPELPPPTLRLVLDQKDTERR